MGKGEPCVFPGCQKEATDTAHFPRTKRAGGISTIPLCHSHHMAHHHAMAGVVDALIPAARAYWQRTGWWELFEESFDTWLERRAYLQRSYRPHSTSYAP